MLIDRDSVGINHVSVAKFGKNENVTTDELVRICTALKRDISGMMGIIKLEREKCDGTSFKDRKTYTGKAYHEMGWWEDPDVRRYYA